MLLFVPGLYPIESNNAMRVAEVIASSQSRLRPGTYSVQVERHETGLTSVASILDPDDDVVLRVVDVDYRPRLAETPYGKSAHSWALLRSGRFALLGLLRLLSATRRSKTGRHRWFLLVGFTLVLLLIGGFVLVALTALEAAGLDKMQEFLPLTIPNEFGWGAGFAVVAGALYWLRIKMLMGSQRVRELVRYLENDREAASVALALDTVIDRILDEGPSPPAIHILAYSFGSIVTLDALFPRVPRRPDSQDRAAAAITSLVTIGCPVDFVRQFYPAYLAGRAPRRTDLPWINLFLPQDLLGSNFLDDEDLRGFESPPAGDEAFKIAGVGPMRSIAVGRDRLTLKSLLSLEGFRVHGEYWDQPQRVNLLEPVINTWIPPTSPAPSS